MQWRPQRPGHSTAILRTVERRAIVGAHPLPPQGLGCGRGSGSIISSERVRVGEVEICGSVEMRNSIALVITRQDLCVR